jgi:hypothetical protein
MSLVGTRNLQRSYLCSNLSFPEPREMLLYVQHDGCSENLSMVGPNILKMFRIGYDIRLLVIPSGENWHFQKGE